MTSKNMVISMRGIDPVSGPKIYTGFDVAYNCGIVSNVRFDEHDGNILFFFRDNKFVECNISQTVEINVPYNSQFGISITNNGQFFFIQSWEKGLFCFDVRTSKLIWHINQKRAYDLAVRDKSVICRCYNQFLSLIDIESGKVTLKYPLRYDSVFCPISDDYFLVGPKRNKYIILDGELNEVVKIPVTQLNPHSHENFIIHKVDFTTEGISMEGVEYSNIMLSNARKTKSINRLIAESKFTRYVSIPELEKWKIREFMEE